MPELTEVRVMDLRQSQVDKLIAKFAPAYPNVTFVGYSDIQEAMNSSDIILTAVHGANNSGQDVLDDKKFEPGQTLVEISGRCFHFRQDPYYVRLLRYGQHRCLLPPHEREPRLHEEVFRQGHPGAYP